jgi:flagellar biosynthesis repressor protein FlbT
MPLKLSLKPGEKFVLNGAVVQNGDRRSALLLQNKAAVLREKDIMQADEAATPARRIYFPVMMMYLDQAGGANAFHDEFIQRLSEFMGAVSNPDILTDCVNISRHVMIKEYYKALMLCRKLIDYEDERLGNVAPRLSAGGAAG